MTPRRWRRVAAGAVFAVSAAAGAPSAVAAPSVADAQQTAAQLRARIDALQVRAEQVAEQYDGAQEQLGVAVQDYLRVEEELGAAETRSLDQRNLAAAKVRGMYESGGPLAVYAAALSATSIGDAVDRVQIAARVIAADRSHIAATGQDIDHLTALHQQLATLADRRNAATTAMQAKAAQVQQLIATQQAALAAADQKVRDLVAAQQRAAEDAAVAAFIAHLDAARAQAAAAGLTVGGTAAPNALAAAAIAAARTRLGTPYVWGATGPGAFDCSGLTGWAYEQAGLDLPRTAAEQWHAGAQVPLAQLEPGDLLFWATDTSNPATIHHVALYIGGGMMIAAPHTGEVVRIQPVYFDGYIGAIRPGAAA